MNFLTDPPVAEQGVPFPLTVFSGGRLSVDLAAHGGITEIRFFGKQKISDIALFRADPLSAFCQLFRPYADFGDHDQYFLEFENTAFYPFGYDSECVFHGIRFRHRFTVLNDALLFELETDAAETPFALKLGLTGAAAPVRKPTREWKRFAPDPDKSFAFASFTDTHDGNSRQTWLVAGSAGKLNFSATHHDIQKDYLSTPASHGYAALAIVFGSEKESAVSRFRELAGNIAESAETERKTYRETLSRSTRLQSGFPILDSFVSNQPEILRSLAVKDLSGAYCASNTGYWVWGWDGMVHADAVMLSGDWENIRSRLAFYRNTADPVHGIFHAIDPQGGILATMAPPAQTIYCIMLFQYWLFSRDLEAIREFYPFATSLLKRVEPEVVGETGLYRGHGLYPDFPEDLGQDGNDISSLNNSILYQAFRCMAELAPRIGLSDEALRWSSRADALRRGFRSHLYDPEKHAFYDSISAGTLEPRKFYPVYAVLAMTPYASELAEGIEMELAQYLYENLRQRRGVSMFDRKDDIFYSDGNQLGFYCPATERFYRRLIRLLPHEDTLLPLIEQEWGTLQISEATSCEAVNMGITPDRPGKKQMYSVTAYYAMIAEILCGIDFMPSGIVFHDPARAIGGWKLKQLRFGRGTLHLEFRGEGRKIVAIELDGRTCRETRTLPANLLENGTHTILIHLKQS